MDIKTGFGYDIHRLEKIDNGYFLLAQVKIEGQFKIVAHSDGDIMLHSLSNAILSALGREDIGFYFPNNVVKTENISSLNILNFALEEMRSEGYHLSNVVVDCVLEKPKLLPYREKVKENLSKFLNIDIKNIAFHCNTNEHVDAVGNSEAIKVFSNILLVKDWGNLWIYKK